MGDEVQAIKAGVMEIGNIFVVNKADREGSRKTVLQLQNLVELSLRHGKNGNWEPLIVQTEAVKARGIEELYEAIGKHRQYLLGNDKGQLDAVLLKRAKTQLLEELKDEAVKTLLSRFETRGVSLDAMIQKVKNRDSDPYSLVQELLAQELR
jgi:LAO/AO transport system kinase